MQDSKIAKFDRKLAREGIALFRDCLPIQIKVIHLCLPLRYPPFNFVLPVLKFILGKRMRHRMVIHHGSDLQVILGYEEYGIGRDATPPALGGHWKMDTEFAAWLVERRSLETRREEAHQ